MGKLSHLVQGRFELLHFVMGVNHMFAEQWRLAPGVPLVAIASSDQHMSYTGANGTLLGSYNPHALSSRRLNKVAIKSPFNSNRVGDRDISTDFFLLTFLA